MSHVPQRRTSRSLLSISFAALAGIACDDSAAIADSAASLNDWLIQDVCADASGRPIMADPYNQRIYVFLETPEGISHNGI